jgi:hypothetical protein
MAATSWRRGEADVLDFRHTEAVASAFVDRLASVDRRAASSFVGAVELDHGAKWRACLTTERMQAFRCVIIPLMTTSRVALGAC